MKISYNWLQNYFEEKLPEPEEISQGIIFHSFEVESLDKLETFGKEDYIFDIKILPDRAHDCLSHWGIAKEISAIFDLKLSKADGFTKQINTIQNINSSSETQLKIEINDPKCLRYMGRIVRNIKVGPSPLWLKEKLETIGQRSINNIVDAANFVMFDLGQPIHCFDLDKLASAKIIVRNGEEGEKLTTLDKKEINLDETILVIADGSTGSPQAKEVLAIAGIKGGTKAEVDGNTKNIVIEVANFNPTTTRKTAKKINILTDAVKRYENQISIELCTKVMDSISILISSLSGGETEEVVDIYPTKQEQRTISVSVSYINKRLDSNFSKEDIESVWQKLSFEYKEKGGNFEIRIPFLRMDLENDYDLVEEVIRILGYDKLEEKLPEVKTEAKTNEIFYKMLWARNKLLEDGYSEVMTYAFRDKGEVEVLASASDKKFLRTNLSDGLKESLKLNQLNLPLLDLKEVKIFEIGTVFLKDKEEIHVAYADKKNIVEVTLNKFCEVNNFQSSLKNSSAFALGDIGQGTHDALNFSSKTSVFKPWSIYPFMYRDIAVWVPEGEDAEKLKKILIENGTDLLIKEPSLFDSFTKDGKTSYAFRLVFQSFERTLVDEEINQIMDKIGHKISENSSWQIR